MTPNPNTLKTRNRAADLNKVARFFGVPTWGKLETLFRAPALKSDDIETMRDDLRKLLAHMLKEMESYNG